MPRVVEPTLGPLDLIGLGTFQGIDPRPVLDRGKFLQPVGFEDQGVLGQRQGIEDEGLELDGVIVVEPADIVESNDRGLRSLFVALTRSTQRLSVVHSRPLPASMA